MTSFNPPLENNIGKFKSWVLASRPKTLTAAVSPVLIGTSVAYYDNKINLIAALIALICSLLIQIGTNFVNDLYDHLKGSDSEDRVGPERGCDATGHLARPAPETEGESQPGVQPSQKPRPPGYL